MIALTSTYCPPMADRTLPHTSVDATTYTVRAVATSGDGPLRPGRLFRSAQPFHLDEADLTLVRDAAIEIVIDLREPHEQVPPDWAPAEALGVDVRRVPVADQILPSADEQ